MLLAGLAFSSLGLLLGLLAGLTTSPVTVTLIGALFAFVGGSAAAYFGKLRAEQLRLATLALLCLSSLMIVGLFSGIAIRVNRLLDLAPAAPPPTRAQAPETVRGQAEPYLRTDTATLEQDLTEQVRSGRETLAHACGLLRAPDAAGRPSGTEGP